MSRKADIIYIFQNDEGTEIKRILQPAVPDFDIPIFLPRIDEYFEISSCDEINYPSYKGKVFNISRKVPFGENAKIYVYMRGGRAYHV